MVFFYAFVHRRSNRSEESCNWVPYGGMMCSFFMWNCMVLTFDRTFGEAWIFQRMKQTLPRQLKAALVLFTALPISHWFTHQFITSGFYSDLALGFPIIKPLIGS